MTLSTAHIGRGVLPAPRLTLPVLIAALFLLVLSAQFLPGSTPGLLHVLPFRELGHRFLRLVRRHDEARPPGSSAWCLAQPLNLVESLLYRGVLAWKWPPLPWLADRRRRDHARPLGRGRRSRCCAAWQVSTWPSSACGRMPCRRSPSSSSPCRSRRCSASARHLGDPQRRAESALTAVFDVMQATPHMAYLARWWSSSVSARSRPCWRR